ncbi:hypothetical protein HYV30_02630 [Candidatus Kaiserbacteria bacterium]|nr:hypothetical protein [Candidatus Kaiserbacteria bacterium]
MYSRALRATALLSLALFLPALAAAQFVGGPSTAPFSISLSPRYPAPQSQAVLSLLSSSINLANAKLSVTVAGKTIYEGAAQPVAIPIGNTGEITSITAVISAGGRNYSQSIQVQPQDVALIVEPVSSAPLLYPGKPMVPLEGSARMVAIANLRDGSGRMLAPNTLSYSWTVDGTNLASASGIGKSSLMVVSPLQYRQRTVSVRVESPDGKLSGGAEHSLSPAQPVARIYRNDPLLGILFNRALSGNFAITTSEESLYAAVFSLPVTSGAPLLQWFLNGKAAQSGSSITLRPGGNGEGTASLSLTASAADTKATATLPLSFGTPAGGNLLGL